MSGTMSNRNRFAVRGGVCRHCGGEILPRRLRNKVVGRARQFCSNKCRQASFRNAEFDRTYQVLAALRNDGNNATASTACKVDFYGRASRLVRDIEQPWRNAGQPIVSPDGVTCFVIGRLRRAR
jgi:hypothetical protein